ncbi:MAG: hypothetical protein ACI4VC_02650 [Clostridia bacterium]
MKKIKEYSKNNKGAISTVVLVTTLFMLTLLSTAYMVITTLRKSQLKSDIATKEVYEKDFNNIDEIEENLLRESRRSNNSSWILLCWRNKR